jgi:nucleotide-binding universal stress UspA family protein
VLVYRPLEGSAGGGASYEPVQPRTVAVALDGSDFSERILPFAAELAKLLSARLQLLQALETTPPYGQAMTGSREDVLESSYLHRTAGEVQERFGIEANWDVLHGKPGEAINTYLKGRQDTLLAMTSHARAGLERALLGSVSSECVRHAGLPILLYWPFE